MSKNKPTIYELEYLVIPKWIYKENKISSVYQERILAFIYTYTGENFYFSNKKLAEMFNIKRQKTVSDVINNLVEYGYIKVNHEQKAGGGRIRFITKSRLNGIRSPARAGGKDNKIKDKTLASQDDAKKKTNKDISETIELFGAVNPSVDRLYGMPPQRQAIERMLNKFGKKKLHQIIKSLAQTNGEKYAPKITTPHQLELSLGKLMAYWRTNRKGGVAYYE